QSVFTDCPHREKLGWLEETHLMGPAIMFNYDVAALYAKVIRDMGEAQRPNGLVPDIAPEYTVFPGSFRDAPAWGSAYVIDPWFAYKTYGDRRVLRQHFAGMKRYAEYLMRQADGGILAYGLGDWGDVGPLKRHWAPQNTPVALTATAIFYYDVAILSKVAQVLGAKEDERRYRRIAEEIWRAFNKTFFNSQTNQYATGSQTSNGMPLALGLVQPEREPAVVENLVRDIRAHGYHTTSGDVGHRFVLLALTQAGRSDVVFEMTRQTTSPSYGYQVEHGATTLTEAWDGPTSGNSQNHFMLGHVEEWFYAGLAGIGADANSPGFQKIILRPQVVGDLEYVRASYNSACGVIKSEWEIKDDQL
ncbi:MAG: alpha-L-rhamnosidase, partial [Acidobacteria bacterium]|nr:alpha-L-rhamnosidase [Acidobacteriota bacterium]